MCGPAPCKEIVPACSPRPTLSPSHFIKRVRDPSRRRSSVRRPRRPRDVDSSTASDEARCPTPENWMCVILLGVVLDVPASVPQLPVLAARFLMSARPRRKERWNQDRLSLRVRGRSCINLLTQRHGRTPPVKKESQRRWYRKRLIAMSSLFRYRFRVASEVHLGRHIMIVVLPGLLLQRCNVVCKLLATGHQKSIGPSSCQ